MSEAVAVDEETGEVIEPDEEEQEQEQTEDDEIEEQDDDRETELAAERQEQAQSIEAQQRVFDRAAKKAENYARGMADTLGEAAQDLIACPRCESFFPGFILPHEVQPVTEEQRVAVKLSMGEAFEPAYPQSDRANACSKCDGWGKVKTGSQVRGQTQVTCPECRGKGWTGNLEVVEQPPFQAPLPPLEGSGEQEQGPAPDTDPWGRMKGDPLYGVMPGYEQ